MYIKHKNDARVKINCKKYKERSFVFMVRVTLNYELVVKDDCIDKKAKKERKMCKYGDYTLQTRLNRMQPKLNE